MIADEGPDEKVHGAARKGNDSESDRVSGSRSATTERVTMNPSDPIPPYEVKEIPGGKPGSRHFRLVRGPFRRLDRDIIKATEEAIAPKGRLGRAFRWVRRVLFGVPLTTAHEVHERLNKVRALAILASDNISSSAYATEEMLRVLVLAGAGALALANPIAIPIVIVLAIVVTSYQQIVRAYVSGGGSYIAARENLGTLPGLTAAAALLTEYVLTVSVSIAAGVAAITSIFPGLFEHRVTIALLAIAVLTIGNLRGIRESGTIFAAPTYIYVFSMLGLLAYGVYRSVSGTMPPYTPPTDWVPDALTPLTILLVLRAFASGAVALTGTEAVSNAVPVFKPPESRNARITLIWMGILFGTIFLGITFLASQLGLVPDPDEVETINSQLTRLLVGQGWYYFLVQSSTAIILLLAANTAFTGFPRLASVLANDDFLPHQFSFRGDRLAFSTGIVVLATIASLLVIAFGGSVTALIPLYTVGVFVAFTLAQAGMVMHWRRLREPRWQIALVINGIGAVATGFVAIEVAAVKFVHGAWIALILTLLLVLMMLAIQNHYKRTERELRLSESDRPLSMATKPQVVIVPVPGLNKSVLRSLTYARSISTNVTAVHVTDDLGSAERLREQWQRWASDIPLVIIESPYRNFTGPLLTYIDLIDKQTPDVPVTVVLPEFFPKHWWENLLHSQRALLLKAALLARPNTVVTDIPYHLRG